ncbi:hypothetical protein RFI_28372, partial [Reticulomyxa filosa]
KRNKIGTWLEVRSNIILLLLITKQKKNIQITNKYIVFVICLLLFRTTLDDAKKEMMILMERLSGVIECSAEYYPRLVAHHCVNDAKAHNYIFVGCEKLCGGMQDISALRATTQEENSGYEKEIRALTILFGDVIKEKELQKKIEQYNGNIESVITDITQKLVQEDNENKKLELEAKIEHSENFEQAKKYIYI